MVKVEIVCQQETCDAISVADLSTVGQTLLLIQSLYHLLKTLVLAFFRKNRVTQWHLFLFLSDTMAFFVSLPSFHIS